jgi:hypothetical protein
VLAPISLAAAVFISFGAATLASWALLELLLRLAKTRGQGVDAQRPLRTENKTSPDVPENQLPLRTAVPVEPPTSEPAIDKVTPDVLR